MEVSLRNSFEVLSVSPSRQMSQRKLSYQGASSESGVPEGKLAPVSETGSPRAVFSHHPAPSGVRNKILPSLTQLAQSRADNIEG